MKDRFVRQCFCNFQTGHKSHQAAKKDNINITFGLKLEVIEVFFIWRQISHLIFCEPHTARGILASSQTVVHPNCAGKNANEVTLALSWHKTLRRESCPRTGCGCGCKVLGCCGLRVLSCCGRRFLGCGLRVLWCCERWAHRCRKFFKGKDEVVAASNGHDLLYNLELLSDWVKVKNIWKEKSYM